MKVVKTTKFSALVVLDLIPTFLHHLFYFLPSFKIQDFTSLTAKFQSKVHSTLVQLKLRHQLAQLTEAHFKPLSAINQSFKYFH